MRPSDKTIIEELTKGNTTVFKYLYSDYAKVTNFILTNRGDEENAKEIFNDSLMVLYRNVLSGNFALNAKLSTYLYSICKKKWLNHLRDEKPNIFESFEDNRLAGRDHGEYIDVDLMEEEYSERTKLLSEAVEDLGEPCLTILQMFYFKKQSMREIAKALDYKSENVAKNQRYRCIQKLKSSLPKDFTEQYY